MTLETEGVSQCYFYLFGFINVNTRVFSGMNENLPKKKKETKRCL